MPLVDDALRYIFDGENPFDSRLFRDSRHAVNRFSRPSEFGGTDLPYAGQPKPKFLFGVRFVSQFGQPVGQYSDRNGNISFMVKFVDKPTITFQSEYMNQYNKKRLVQTKHDYNPLTLRFYDAVDDRLLRFIRDYMRYYYGDYDNLSVGSWRYDQLSDNFYHGASNWGFKGVSMPGQPNSANFMSHIELYQFYGSKFTRFIYVNPLIDSIDFDNSDVEQSSMSTEVTMSCKYEGLIFDDINEPITSDIVEMFKLEEYADFLELPEPLTVGSYNLGGIRDINSARQVFGREISRDLSSQIGSAIANATTQSDGSSALGFLGDFDFGSVAGNAARGVITGEGVSSAASTAVKAGVANLGRDIFTSQNRDKLLGTGIGGRPETGATVPLSSQGLCGNGSTQGISSSAVTSLGSAGGTTNAASEANTASILETAYQTGQDAVSMVTGGIENGVDYVSEVLGVNNTAREKTSQIGKSNEQPNSTNTVINDTNRPKR